jgi:hypothetical protein
MSVSGDVDIEYVHEAACRQGDNERVPVGGVGALLRLQQDLRRGQQGFYSHAQHRIVTLCADAKPGEAAGDGDLRRRRYAERHLL